MSDTVHLPPISITTSSPYKLYSGGKVSVFSICQLWTLALSYCPQPSSVFAISHLYLSLYIQQQWFLQSCKSMVEPLANLKAECGHSLPHGHLLTWAALCQPGAQGAPNGLLWTAVQPCTGSQRGAPETGPVFSFLSPLFHCMALAWDVVYCCSNTFESAPGDGCHCCYNWHKTQWEECSWLVPIK